MELRNYASDLVQSVVHWKELGTELGLTNTFLSTLHSNYPNDDSKIKSELIKKWITTDTNPTREKLLSAMENLKGMPCTLYIKMMIYVDNFTTPMTDLR